jgi:spore coat protein CotH
MKKTAVFLSLMLCGVLLLSGCVQTDSSNRTSTSTTSKVTYSEKLFKRDTVHSIDIALKKKDWADLKANPVNKTKYKADVTIDGETISNVSFATKGNSSLLTVAQDPDSIRYSFKINFGKYALGQTYYGLDQLSLNNLYADATYMKDYLSYRIFEEAGVDAPLASYAWVTVNGETVGLYLALEEIDTSYLERTNEGLGELYKPETTELANMNDQFLALENEPLQDTNALESEQETLQDETVQESEQELLQDTTTLESEQENDNGATLKYRDENIASYSDIFDHAETTVNDADKQRVIQALKTLSEGDAATALNTEEVISYFVAHNFVMNYDSYTGEMLHNYYLYEKNGELSMLPWDYNLAFGIFMDQDYEMTDGEHATMVVNYGIDSPLVNAKLENRPMWSWIVKDKSYLGNYHEHMNNLIVEYFESGRFEKEITQLYEMITPYVEKDDASFFTVKEYQAGYQALKAFCLKRAESIRFQLNGQLSTITSEQVKESRVDASDISLVDMGAQGIGSRKMMEAESE